MSTTTEPQPKAKRDKSTAKAPTQAKAGGGVTLVRVLLVALLLLAVSFAGLVWYGYRSPSVGEVLTLDQVYELAAQGNVRVAKLLDQDAVVIGQRCLGASGSGVDEDTSGPQFPERRRACQPPLEPFQTAYPSSDVATQQLIERMAFGGAQVEVDTQPAKAVARLLVTSVYPVLFLAAVFGLIFLARGGGGGGGGMSDIAGFGSFRKGKADAKKPATGAAAGAAGGGAYASFWRRLVGYLLDALVVVGLVLVLMAGYAVVLAARQAAAASVAERLQDQAAVLNLVGLAAYFVYDTVMTSRYGWTLGKRAVGIEVRAADGHLLSWGRAAARFVARIVSAVPLYLGFVWAAWDPRTQTWHDKFAGSFVVLSDGGQAAAADGSGPTSTTGVTFADVGGAGEAVTELREVTDYLTDPGKFEAYGAIAPKGVLLFGPPGCGKTLMARAVAGEAAVPFFAVSGAEFVESLVGVGAARVRDLFAQVRVVAPAIVFIDEIDAVGRKRSGEGSSGGEREQTINQLLVEMDGFEVGAGIVLMGATNRPDILDPALMRPGRFDRHVTLEPPDIDGRLQILGLHAAGKPLDDIVDLGSVAKRTPGFTGADLANVINEAALLALRQGAGTRIGMRHLGEAIERVLHGPQRRGKLVSADERRRLAFHESGHALVAAAVGQAGGVQRVSILARGRGLGSSLIADDERVLMTTSDLDASLMVAMGGIAAERLVYGEVSTTAEDDLDKANAIAREMVGIHGMSEEVGPLRLLRPEEGFLGADVRLVEAISGQTMGLFDAAVRGRIEAARVRAEQVLGDSRDRLDAMAGALEEHESLEGAALDTLLAGMPEAGVAAPTVTGNGTAKARQSSRSRSARGT